MIHKEDFDTSGDTLPRPFLASYWLLPGRVLAGEHPARHGPERSGEQLAERLQALRRAGITHFIDLSSEHDRLPLYEPVQALHLPHPIVDFGIPTQAGMRATLHSIARALDDGGGVYIHCKAGVGRTGTVAGCLLVEHGFAPGEALALLQRKWQVAQQREHSPLTPETDDQRAFIAAWAAQLRSASSRP